MKIFIQIILALLLSVNCFGKDHSAENMAEFQSEFKGLIEMDGKTLYIQRVIPFDNMNKEALMNGIKCYISNRIERKSTGQSSNSDIIYDDDAIIVTECSPVFKVAGGWYCRVNYVYKFEAKEGRVRVTMFINSYDVGKWTHTVDKYYPFVKERNKPFVKTSKALFHAFVDYANSTFSSFPEELRNCNSKRSNDDW